MQHFGEHQPFSSDFASLASVSSDFDVLARCWPELLPDRIHTIRYESLVKDAESTLRTVLAFIGLDWNENVLDHTHCNQPVNTASVGQVRQPLFFNSAGRWGRYGPYLKDLAASLGDHDLKILGSMAHQTRQALPGAGLFEWAARKLEYSSKFGQKPTFQQYSTKQNNHTAPGISFLAHCRPRIRRTFE